MTKDVKAFFEGENVRQKFNELIGKRSTSFITSIIQIVASSDKLQKADPLSVYNAACIAAVLDLPINPNLGFAYIIPYNLRHKDEKGKEYWTVVAQFQIGYKGFIQLAQRSGVFKTINVTDVREGEIEVRDRLSGEIAFRWHKVEEERNSKAIIGYVAYFKLLNGFEKMFYMTYSQLLMHAETYSKTFKETSSLWKKDFDAMASKTVLKLLLSRFAPMSVEMQKAITADQAVINDETGNNVTYPDNQPTKEDEEIIMLWDGELQQCKSLPEIEKLEKDNIEVISANDFIMQMFAKAKQKFTNGKEKSALLAQQTQLLLDQKDKNKK